MLFKLNEMSNREDVYEPPGTFRLTSLWSCFMESKQLWTRFESLLALEGCGIVVLSYSLFFRVLFNVFLFLFWEISVRYTAQTYFLMFSLIFPFMDSELITGLSSFLFFVTGGYLTYVLCQLTVCFLSRPVYFFKTSLISLTSPIFFAIFWTTCLLFPLMNWSCHLWQLWLFPPNSFLSAFLYASLPFSSVLVTLNRADFWNMWSCSERSKWQISERNKMKSFLLYVWADVGEMT